VEQTCVDAIRWLLSRSAADVLCLPDALRLSAAVLRDSRFHATLSRHRSAGY